MSQDTDTLREQIARQVRLAMADERGDLPADKRRAWREKMAGEYTDAIMALLPSLPVSPDIEDLIAWHDAEGVARGIGGYSKMEDIHRGTAKALRTLSERVKELEAGIDPFARYGRIHRAMREASARTTMPTRGTLFGLSSVHGDADIDVEDFDRAVALAGDAQ